MKPAIMKRRILSSICLFSLVLLATACGPSRRDDDAEGAADGESLYRRHCQTCHELYDPRDYSPSEWARNVKRYGPRAGLDREEQALVLDWLAEQTEPAAE